jgi:hypothetical protein
MFYVALILLSLAIAQCGGVTNSPTTPAALDCNPTNTDAANWYTNVYLPTTALQAQTTYGNTCLGCHGNSPGTDFSRLSRFRINTNNATDVNVQKQNICIMYQWGQKSPDQELVTHPQGTQHDGGQVTAAQISGLVNWVNTYRLPSDQTPPTY